MKPVIDETRQLLGASMLQAIMTGNGRTPAPTILDLGDVQATYETLFWRPYLGAPAFALYQSLVGFATSAAWAKTAVTVEMIVRTMGQGNRHTILGRAASGRMPAQPGAAALLEREGIIDHLRRHKGRETVHIFYVLAHLPTLTPIQAESLGPQLAEMHDWYLGSLRGFDVVDWRKVDAPSLVGELVKRDGRLKVGQ